MYTDYHLSVGGLSPLLPSSRVLLRAPLVKICYQPPLIHKATFSIPHPRQNIMNIAALARSLWIFLLGTGLLLPHATPLSFNFPDFPVDNTSDSGIIYLGDAKPVPGLGVIDLTNNRIDANLNGSLGWAVYSHLVRLVSFNTTFSFVIDSLEGPSTSGDGIAFFLAPEGTVPNGRGGGALGLFDDFRYNDTIPPPRPIVAVEFDTNQNVWDPPAVHVGIDITSRVSVVNISWTNFSKTTVSAAVSYDASEGLLSARFSNENGYERNLNWTGNLSQVLPEWVTIGFSASTGRYVEIHKLLSWNFTSTEFHNDKNSRVGLLAGLIIGLGSLAAVSGTLVWYILRHKKVTSTRIWRRGEGVEMNTVDDSEIDEGRGAKRFTYHELARATRNFAPDGKLGRGGFGEVYKGFLAELELHVAVKRVAKDSAQGKKEYLSEINIISRLRHRNLVRLVGWCHDNRELLLVYEYLPNGSLDAHLFGKALPLLKWPMRYKIAQGLASALLYLHEGWEQCVLHRDVKSSNVMLDADFNSKLGDFGLARLVDHGVGMQTTVPAGTWGYLPPECAVTGKASKESDVYSFGVVALEIACGRKAIDPKAEEAEKVMLVGWVWGLYGQHALLDAADQRLPHGDRDDVQMERLMVVGLWCAHPDPSCRPSIRQVVAALNFETSPPWLPDQMPELIYGTPRTGRRQSMAQSSSGHSASSTALSSTTGGPYTAASSATASTYSSAGSDAAERPLMISEQSS